MCDTENKHMRLRHTHATVLLALGRETDAWRVVHQADALRHGFAPITTLAQDPRYAAWLNAGQE